MAAERQRAHMLRRHEAPSSLGLHAIQGGCDAASRCTARHWPQAGCAAFLPARLCVCLCLPANGGCWRVPASKLGLACRRL